MARYEDEYKEEPKEQACFIATAALGTPAAVEIDILRQFRDEVLRHNPAGRAFIVTYYKLSPPVARFIARHRSLRFLVRKCIINPAVSLSRSYQQRHQ